MKMRNVSNVNVNAVLYMTGTYLYWNLSVINKKNRLIIDGFCNVQYLHDARMELRLNLPCFQFQGPLRLYSST